MSQPPLDIRRGTSYHSRRCRALLPLNPLPSQTSLLMRLRGVFSGCGQKPSKPTRVLPQKLACEDRPPASTIHQTQGAPSTGDRGPGDQGVFFDSSYTSTLNLDILPTVHSTMRIVCTTSCQVHWGEMCFAVPTVCLLNISFCPSRQLTQRASTGSEQLPTPLISPGEEKTSRKGGMRQGSIDPDIAKASAGKCDVRCFFKRGSLSCR